MERKQSNIFEKENELFAHFIKNDDRESFEKLYKAVEPWLFKMIFRIVSDRNVAEDILQKTWLKIIESRNNFDCRKGKFVNYIYTIAKNYALQWKNHEKVERHSLHKLSLSSSFLTEPQYIDDISEIIRLAILKLENPNFQDALLLYYFAGLSISEIAARLNTNEQNIKNWLNRAKNKIEDDLKELSDL